MLFDKRWADAQENIAPTTIEGHRRAFCNQLERGRWQQRQGSYGWSARSRRVCALGAAIAYCGRNPVMWAGLIAPLATRGRLNLTVRLSSQLQWWNDSSELTFPQIAQRLRQVWGVRP
jgi:hypothetical protein